MFHSDRPSAWTVKAPMLAALVIAGIAGGIVADRYALNKPASETATSEQAEDASVNALKLSPGRIRDARIGLARVRSGALSNQILAQATVAATPEGAALIGARADGTVTEIRKRLGDDVKKGDVLGSIQSREAAMLAEAHGAAEARLAKARPAFERQKSLMAQGATARQDYDAAEAEWRMASAELARANAAASASGLARDGVSLNILSPVSGRITAASAVLGAYVVAGTELFRVADPGRLEVQAALPSADAQRVAVGDSAEIDAPEGMVPARVRAITPDINLQSRAATVILTPLRPGSLQPGQLLAARIIVKGGARAQAAILVPDAALQKMNGEDALFVRTQNGFEKRAVTLGSSAGGMTEIRSGLSAGEEIATANSFLIKAELEKGSAGDDE